jgi:tetratricopeptide (TPR) repeat protein
LVDILAYPDLIQIISGGEGLNAGKCMVLAELLKLKADMAEAQGVNALADNLYLKSLNLFIEAQLLDNQLCSAINIIKIDEIIKIIKVYESPDESKYLLFQYYEQIERYDKAENVFFKLLESKQYDSDVLEKGLAFYQRLMSRSEWELSKGNLPLPEVMESYKELCAHKK